jgi:hypothetical protein
MARKPEYQHASFTEACTSASKVALSAYTKRKWETPKTPDTKTVMFYKGGQPQFTITACSNNTIVCDDIFTRTTFERTETPIERNALTGLLSKVRGFHWKWEANDNSITNLYHRCQELNALLDSFHMENMDAVK